MTSCYILHNLVYTYGGWIKGEGKGEKKRRRGREKEEQDEEGYDSLVTIAIKNIVLFIVSLVDDK